MFLSPKAQKAHDEAAGRRNAQQSFFDEGPHLADSDEVLVIPSPAPHEKFNQVLRAYGFTFEPGFYPQWRRPTGRPHRGKRYTPAGWLTWARAHYAKAWQWQPIE